MLSKFELNFSIEDILIEDILFTKELLRIILSTEIPVLLGKGKYVVRQIIKTGFAGRKVL